MLHLPLPESRGYPLHGLFRFYGKGGSCMDCLKTVSRTVHRHRPSPSFPPAGSVSSCSGPNPWPFYLVASRGIALYHFMWSKNPSGASPLSETF